MLTKYTAEYILYWK